MKVGVTFWFQNLPDFYGRAKGDDYSRPSPLPDSQVYANQLHLADLVEPLGFDSLWALEHHFGPYSMTPNPFQLLSYVAGRTTRIELGTMVTVLPWWEPLRVAESICMLDNMMRGRRLHLGFGRGAAPQEFDGFRIPYDDSRERMREAFEIVRLALSEEWFSYAGTHFQIPETTIRPRPFTPNLVDHFALTWSTPETMQWAATTGAGQLYSNITNADALARSSAAFNAIRAANGLGPTAPIATGPVFCSNDRDAIEQARDWFSQTVDSSLWHYGLFNQPSIRKLVKGKRGAELDAAIDKIFENTARLGVFGTPGECIEQLSATHATSGLGHLIANLHFGLMPVETAEASMRLFAAEVVPALQQLPAATAASTAARPSTCPQPLVIVPEGAADVR